MMIPNMLQAPKMYSALCGVEDVRGVVRASKDGSEAHLAEVGKHDWHKKGAPSVSDAPPDDTCKK